MMNLPQDVKSLLLGAGAELTASLVERALDALGPGVIGTPRERSLRRAYARAGAAVLACLDLPEDPDELAPWSDHVQELFDPILEDEQVQVTVTESVLHKGGYEAIDPAPFLSAWARCHGEGAENTLPWREGFDLSSAVREFGKSFERKVECVPELHTFLLASRLKRVVNHMESGIPVEGMQDLLVAIESLHNQQARILDLMGELARWGISVRRDGTIVGEDNRTLQTKGGEAEILMNALRSVRYDLAKRRAHEREALLVEFQAHKPEAVAEASARPDRLILASRSPFGKRPAHR